MKQANRKHIRRVHTKYFAVLSAGTYYPRAFSTDRVHTGVLFPEGRLRK